MEKKTAKALYELLKELYQSRAAKEFVDAYEHEQRHESQAVPLNRSIEKQRAYNDLIKLEDLEKIQQAAKTFADICKREKPKVGEVYRDIFGNRYFVLAVHDSSPDGKPVKKPLVMLTYSNAKGELSSSTFFAVPLEDFMNPTFKKE